MRRLLSVAAAVLMFSGVAHGASRVRGAKAAPHGNAIHVQGFYRVDPFTDWPGFYHQYPYTLFGYPNYTPSIFPLYHEFEYPKSNCDFVWPRHRTNARGVWTCR